jgi:A/G-specific adenine glycosylase
MVIGLDTDPGVGQRRRRLVRTWSRARIRHFPWRSRPEPWAVFIAENLLRRTRAEQVASLLPRILAEFPTPNSMAVAPLQDVQYALAPLGLRFRAAQLQQSAAIIVSTHDGQVPLDLDALMELPGVGPYVAAATLSMLTRRRVILTDTNTVRVAKRVSGVTRPGDIRRSKDLQSAIHDLLGGPATARAWWAVIDLAATICTPRNPDCTNCPIADLCITGSERTGSLVDRGKRGHR